MAYSLPKIWHNIKLLKTKINGDVEEYSSKIVEVEKNEQFLIETPLKKMQLVMLMNGSRLNVVYNIENIGMLSFDAEVVEKIRDNGIPLIRIKKVSQVEKIQRRNFFRLDIAIDVSIRKENDIITEKAKTIDISGGGMKILTTQNFEIGDIVKLNFLIAKSEFDFDSQVVKLDGDREKREISVQFLDVSEKDRNEIIKFIFDEQRKGIKKGIISNG